MESSLAFTPSRVSELPNALGALLSGPEGKEAGTRPAGGNFFILGVPSSAMNDASNLAQILAQVHKARFFIVAVDPSAHELTAETATLCLRLSDSTAACAELVRLRSPVGKSAAVVSVIRANCIPGFESELFIWDWTADRETTAAMIEHVDTVMYDSRSMKEPLEFLERISKVGAALVDFNWVRLGAWRDQVKAAFDRPVVRDLIPELSRVRILASGQQTESFDPTISLLAGWVVTRLRVDPLAVGSAGFECVGRGRDVEKLFLDVVVRPGTGAMQIDEMSFVAGDAVNSPFVTVRRTDRFETIVSAQESFSFSQPVDGQDIETIAERYFLVGESTTNYTGALKAGLELARLRAGYRGA